jgi:hypothetical protein
MIVLSYLEKDALEKIYELTYKYGWLMREYEDKGWLPDSGYMAFNKIQGEIAPAINNGLQGMLDTYDEWLNAHQRYTWIESFKENQISDIIHSLTNWLEFNVDEVTTKILADNIDVQQDVLDNLDYYKESLAEQYLFHVRNNAKYYASKFGQPFIDEVETKVDEAYNDELLKDLIEEYGDDLEDNFVGWVSAEYFDKYSMAEERYESDPEHYVEEYLDTILELAYDHYLHRFSNAARDDGKALVEEIKDVEAMRDELVGFDSLDLDEKIILFQKGLTTSHHHGTMADHLIQVDMGEGKDFLDNLSASPEADTWNIWLEKVLGHPLFQAPEEEKLY